MLVTTTFAAPAEPDGVVQVRDVDPDKLGEVQVLPPTLAVAPVRNPVPVMVRDVLPAVGPEVGETDETVGAALKVKALESVPVIVSGLVTTTLTVVPAVPEGVVQVIDVALATLGDVQVFPPTVTVAPD